MRLVIDLPEEVYTDIHDNYIGRDVLFLGVKYGIRFEKSACVDCPYRPDTKK